MVGISSCATVAVVVVGLIGKASADVGVPAMAPVVDDGLAPVADAGGVPDEGSLGALATPFIVAANVEYSPDIAAAAGVDATAVEDIIGLNPATPEECAEACAAEDGCNAASWYGANAEWTNDLCYLKTIGTPCMAPTEAAPTPDVYMLIKNVDCDIPVVIGEAAGPGMDLAPLPVLPGTPLPVDPIPPVIGFPAEGPLPFAPMGAPMEVSPVEVVPLAPIPAIPATPLPADGPLPAGGPLPDGGPDGGDRGVGALAPTTSTLTPVAASGATSLSVSLSAIAVAAAFIALFC